MAIFLSTGSLRKYFSPTHNRRVATFSCVTKGVGVICEEGEEAEEEEEEEEVGGVGFRIGERDEGGGGVGPPIVMAET